MRNLSEHIKQASDIDIPSFPFDDDTLRSIIENSESRPGSQKPLITKTGAIIMGILGLILIIIISLLFNGGVKTDITVGQESKPVNAAITGQPEALPPAMSFLQKDEPEEDTDEYRSKEPEQKEDIKSNSCVLLAHPSIPSHGLRDYLRKLREPSYYFYPQSISDKQFGKLNVIINGNKLRMLTESLYDNKTEKYSELQKIGYPEYGICRQSYIIDENLEFQTRDIDYGGWSRDSSSLVSPIGLIYYKWSDGTYTDSLKMVFQNNPFFDSAVYPQLDKEITEISSFVVNTMLYSSLQYGYEPNFKLEIMTESYPVVQYLTPVYKIKYLKKDTLIFVLWYPTTKELLDVVPEGKNEDLVKTRRHQINGRYGYKNYRKERINNNNGNKLNISGISKLLLTKPEMEKLGITVFGDSCIIPIESLLPLKNVPDSIKAEVKSYGFNPNLEYILMKESVVMDSHTVHRMINTYSGWDHTDFSKTKPVYIVMKGPQDIHGTYTNSYTSVYSDFSPILDSSMSDIRFGYIRYNSLDDIRNISKLSKLLPVNFIIGDTNALDKRVREYFIWFIVNEEFTELLPDRYRVPIRKELEIIRALESGDMDPEQACDAMRGDVSYLGLCRTSSGAIRSVSITPNPARDNFTIRVELRSDLDLSVDLYDYTGVFISNLKTGSYKAGRIIEEMIVPELKDGVYLVMVSDKHGNQVVQKLIICK